MESLTACKLVHYVGSMGLFLTTFTMTVEMVGPKWKTFMGNALQIPFAIGEVIVSIIAMFCTDWKIFQVNGARLVRVCEY